MSNHANANDTSHDGHANDTSRTPGKGGGTDTSVPTSNAVTVFRLAAGFTFLAVAIGAVVCATESGASCPTWPGCHPGQVVPGAEISPIIEFGHRVTAFGAGPLVLAAALMVLRMPRHAGSVPPPSVRVLPWVSLGCAIASGVFGRLVVLSGLPTWLGGVDLLCALTSMSTMALAAVRIGQARDSGAGTGAGVGEGAGAGVMSVARPAAGAVSVLVAMHVSGIFAAGKGSFTRCTGWPLLRIVETDPSRAWQVARLGLAVGAAVLIVTAVRAASAQMRLRRWASVIGGLLAVELALNLVIVGGGTGRGLAAAYVLVAVGLLWGLVLLSAVTSVTGGGPGAGARGTAGHKHPVGGRRPA